MGYSKELGFCFKETQGLYNTPSSEVESTLPAECSVDAEWPEWEFCQETELWVRGQLADALCGPN